MDMVAIPIVQKFLDWAGRARVAETSLFPLQKGNQIVMMLGTYAPTQKLGWGVIVQRKTSDALLHGFRNAPPDLPVGACCWSCSAW